ncbi:MAG: acyl-CoA dehydrogenase family protein [Cyanobacteria bacterium SZAS LIN-2]|nr:acyl-CoA dehydrogenase family protein [Cyanobacteria bacterium SZAS LIN-3]MBS1995383.1 acyl-CoA dehydrogenase family protein [Cyanobacteria bacterium SZAS LIN-2]
MNTFLSLAHKASQDEYLKFVSEHIAPRAHELDRGELAPKDVLATLAQAGYLGITVPASYGGKGGNLLDLTILAEILAGHAAGVALALASHYTVVELILNFGSDQQKSRYLPLLARGEVIGAQAFGEEKAGSDFKAVQATAVVEGDAAALNATKTWVVNGEIAQLLAVLAKSGDQLSLWLVDANGEKNAADSLKVGPARAKMGMRSAVTNDIILTNHKVSLDNRLGGASATCDQVVKAVEHALDVSKTVLAGAALGLADQAIALGAERARTHEQFGESISKFQGIQWKLADLSMDRAAAQMLTYRAAWSKDEEPENFHKYSAMAKMFAAKVARFHSGEALQIFGVLGASPESEIERIYRDSKLTEVFEGASEYQKVIIKEELGV